MNKIMMMVVGAAGLGLVGVISACAPKIAESTGRNDFMALCVDCHGPAGKGDGPLADGLNPHPADITKVAAGNGGIFPRQQVMNHIDGFTMGRSESPMPAFGELLEGKTVLYDSGDGIASPTPARLVALMEYVEGLQE